jgi:uncharacterized Fe-S cluster-containing MiaB family protein
MKEYMVSLNLVTNLTVTEKDVIKLFPAATRLNHRAIGDKELWRLESQLGKQESIPKQIESILSFARGNRLFEIGSLIKMLYFDIGVFFDTANCSVTIPSDCLRSITRLSPEIGIEITCYPTSESTGKG